MASAHHSRYPPPNSNSDFRLPSLKDLNFPYRPPPQDDQQQQPQDLPVRHAQSWPRSASNSTTVPSPMPPPSSHHHHQQHTPPLSAGHELAPSSKVDYPQKHENGPYVHPSITLSAQVTPVQPPAVPLPPNPRLDDVSHSPNQTKRPRIHSQTVVTTRDIRTPHQTPYPPQYAPYPQQPPAPNSYHHMPSAPAPPVPGPPSHVPHPTHHVAPPPPTHDQLPHPSVPIAAHPGYSPYPSQYMPPRPPVHPHHPQQQPSHTNPYPSPGPPPSVPPPAQAWTHPQHHQLPPPQAQHPSQPPPHPPHHHHHHHHHHHQPAPSSLPAAAQSHMHPQQPQQQQQQQRQQPLPPQQQPQQHQQQQPQQHQHQSQHQHQQPHPAPPPAAHHVAMHTLAHHPQQVTHLAPATPVQHHQPQQSQQAFSRSTAIIPTNVETRDTYVTNEQERIQPARDGIMDEVVKHCTTLYTFANRFVQPTMPHTQPSATDLAEMSRLAVQVVQMLEEWKRNNVLEVDRVKLDSSTGFVSTDDARPPKRPWEDMAKEGVQDESEAGPPSEYNAAAAAPDKSAQSTAEQDMELIRTKRATSAAGGSGPSGQPKSKYRKRSRATPPGKCHSCNIRETPEWRRGPDGARTLCNACGLHYAKLMRKKDKSGNGGSEQISLEALRASARSGDLEKNRKGSRTQQSSEISAPMEGVKQTSHQQQQQQPAPPPPPPPQQHHQGSFQVVSMDPDTASSSVATEASHMQSANHQSVASSASQLAVPSHSWSTPAPHPSAAPVPHATAPPSRGYAPEQFQHQSFLRASQHAAVPQATSR